MTKNTALKFINPVLGVFLINQILTGIFADPLFALSPKAFEILHEDAGFVLAGLAILHVVLNWNWIKATFFRKPMAPKA